MPLRIANIAIDCADVAVVSRFWSAALWRPLDPGSGPGFASIGGGDAGRTQPAWYFERVPEPKRAKNRLHVDFVDPDPNAVAHLESLGASVVARHALGDHRWTVMHDPEGNEFCIAERSSTG